MTKIIEQYLSDCKNNANPSPIVGLGIGLGILFPLAMATERVATKTLDNLGIYTPLDNPFYHWWKRPAINTNSWHDLLRTTIFYPIANQIFFREIVQNYLLDTQLKKVILKVAPEQSDFLQTTKGKIFRVIATSLLEAGLSYFKIAGETHRVVINGYLSNTSTIENKWLGAQCLTGAINIFVLALFSGAAREVTGSLLPGIGLDLIHP